MSDPYNDIKLEINLYLVDEILSVLKQFCHRYELRVCLIDPRPTFWKNSKQLIFIVLCGTQISSSDFVSTSFSCSNHESSESWTQHFPKLLFILPCSIYLCISSKLFFQAIISTHISCIWAKPNVTPISWSWLTTSQYRLLLTEGNNPPHYAVIFQLVILFPYWTRYFPQYSFSIVLSLFSRLRMNSLTAYEGKVVLFMS